MKLSSDDYEAIYNSFLDAFNYPELSAMLNAKMGVRLRHISAETGMREVIGSLLDWAQHNDKIDGLIKGAKAWIPTNHQLRALPNSFENTDSKEDNGILGSGKTVAKRDLFKPIDERLREKHYRIALEYAQTQAILREFDLSMRNLSGVSFCDAELQDANLIKANLSEADLCGADLSGADLTRANLNHARYNSLTKWPIKFDYKNSGAFGPFANLEGANLSRVNLSQVNLSDAELRGADLSKSNLSGANLSKADLTETILYKTKYDGSTKWPLGFDYKNSGAIGPLANFSGADLSGVDITGVDLNGAIFRRTNLSTANLSEINLSGANLSGADLSEANLRGTNLSGANLTGTNLSGATLYQADLSNANLSQATLNRANLTETILFGV